MMFGLLQAGEVAQYHHSAWTQFCLDAMLAVQRIAEGI